MTTNNGIHSLMEDLIQGAKKEKELQPLVPASSIDEPEKIKTSLDREIEARSKEIERASIVYQKYQSNILKSEEATEAILKGVKSGENIYHLFLLAVKVIAIMTGNEVIYSNVKEEVPAVYGIGLQHPEALTDKIQEVQKRIGLIQNNIGTVDDPDIKLRLQNAVRKNINLLDQLQKAHSKA